MIIVLNSIAHSLSRMRVRIPILVIRYPLANPPPLSNHTLEDILVLMPSILMPILGWMSNTVTSAHWWQCSNRVDTFHNQCSHNRCSHSWPCFINSSRIAMWVNTNSRHLKDRRILLPYKHKKYFEIFSLFLFCFAYWCNFSSPPFAYCCTIDSVGYTHLFSVIFLARSLIAFFFFFYF